MPYEYLSYKPYASQLATIKFLLNNKKSYVFSDLGSGKTASVLWACDQLLEAEKITHVLIVCPLSIMQSVWGVEISNILPNRSYSIVHGNRADRLRALKKRAHFYITNSDAPRTYCPELIQLEADILVIDEVDAFKNAQSKRSKKAQIISRLSKATWAMTGTVMSNSPMEAFGIARVTNPSKLPTPYVTHWKRLTMYQISQFLWVPNENCECLVHSTLQPAIRYTLDECVDIPDIIYETTSFKMTTTQAKLYKDMMNHQIADYDDGKIIAATAAVKHTKLLQIAAGVVLSNEGEPIVTDLKPKIEEVMRIKSQTNKLIIFVQFVAIIKELEKILPNCLSLYGAIPVKKRAKVLEDFENTDIDILLVQPRVGAHGLNLQFSNTVIFWTPILGNSYYRQCIGRIRRGGQKHKQLIINFSTSQVEKKLYKTLESKEVSSQILLNMYVESRKTL